MARAKIVRDIEGRFYGVHIKCPSCGNHVLPVSPVPDGEAESPDAEGLTHWAFNGDYEHPTFSPSILARAGDPGAYTCHSFVAAGRIRFLGDCTHKFRGQTVDLPEVEDSQ